MDIIAELVRECLITVLTDRKYEIQMVCRYSEVGYGDGMRVTVARRESENVITMAEIRITTYG